MFNTYYIRVLNTEINRTGLCTVYECTKRKAINKLKKQYGEKFKIIEVNEKRNEKYEKLKNYYSY